MPILSLLSKNLDRFCILNEFGLHGQPILLYHFRNFGDGGKLEFEFAGGVLIGEEVAKKVGAACIETILLETILVRTISCSLRDEFSE